MDIIKGGLRKFIGRIKIASDKLCFAVYNESVELLSSETNMKRDKITKKYIIIMLLKASMLKVKSFLAFRFRDFIYKIYYIWD